MRLFCFTLCCWRPLGNCGRHMSLLYDLFIDQTMSRLRDKSAHWLKKSLGQTAERSDSAEQSELDPSLSELVIRRGPGASWPKVSGTLPPVSCSALIKCVIFPQYVIEQQPLPVLLVKLVLRRLSAFMLNVSDSQLLLCQLETPSGIPGDPQTLLTCFSWL